MSKPIRRIRQYLYVLTSEGIIGAPVKNMHFLQAGEVNHPEEKEGDALYVLHLDPRLHGVEGGDFCFHQNHVFKTMDDAIGSLEPGAVRPAHRRLRRDQRRQCGRALPPPSLLQHGLH